MKWTVAILLVAGCHHASPSSQDVTTILTAELRTDGAAASALCHEPVSGLDVTNVEVVDSTHATVTGVPIDDDAAGGADAGPPELCTGTVAFSLEADASRRWRLVRNIAVVAGVAAILHHDHHNHHHHH